MMGVISPMASTTRGLIDKGFVEAGNFMLATRISSMRDRAEQSAKPAGESPSGAATLLWNWNIDGWWRRHIRTTTRA